MDVAGNVVVTGRIKDAIIRNAENISALEIEESIGHPSCGGGCRGHWSA